MNPHQPITLDAALASKFAQVALGHLTREYPNKLDHVMAGEADVQGPQALHPIFTAASTGIPACMATG